MITNDLKTLLSAAGCTLVLYESDKLAGIITDQANQNHILGLIIQPNEVELIPAGTGIRRHYPPITVEIMKQVRPEDTAENNEATLEALFGIVEKFYLSLMNGTFKKLGRVTVVKIQETKYDANMIGWMIPLDLTHNENKTSC